MSPTTVSVFAPAKINLALHITGQRSDGYHFLDSLVAFASVGDRIRISPGTALFLTVEGPEANGVPAGMDNLALKAAALVNPDAGAALTLEKRLPSASGIGGGSADAAAACRGILTFRNTSEGVERLGGPTASEIAARSEELLALGADIPMCLLSHPARVRGIGEQVESVHLPPLPAVLINPRVPVSTPAVFRELAKRDNAPLPDKLPAFSDSGSVIDWLQDNRNDLEEPAMRIAPVIGDVLEVLRATEGCGLARMSGSGATCYGLFPDVIAAQSAVEKLCRSYPDWWIAGCILGDQSDAARPRIS